MRGKANSFGRNSNEDTYVAYRLSASPDPRHIRNAPFPTIARLM
jgi:hypothetical protein